MKKVFALTCMSLLTLTCVTGCNKTTINVDEAKEIAAEQIDGIAPEDLSNCKTVNVNGKNIYRVRYENYNEFLRYEIDIDPIGEDVIQVESESLSAGQEDDIGKEAAKKAVLDTIPGSTDFDIIRCTYSTMQPESLDSNEEVSNPYYDIIFYKAGSDTDILRSYHVDAITKEVTPIEDEEEKDDNEIDNNPSQSINAITESNNETRNAENADRPVWLTSHRCNTNYYNRWFSKQHGTLRPNEKRDTWIALNGGCNGVEVDIRHRRDGTLRLCHDNTCSIDNSESVEEFLELPEMKDERMCVVIFDMKEPQYFQDLANIVHTKLPNTKINFIYSVDKLKYARQYFTSSFVNSLKPNEGICVDYHDSADEIEGLYTDLNFYRGWYGDGIFSGIASRATTRGCKRAIEIRNRTSPTSHIKRVENWTVNTERRFRDRLGGWGLDSVMLSGRMTKKAKRVLGQVSGVHLAKQSEQMF